MRVTILCVRDATFTGRSGREKILRLLAFLRPRGSLCSPPAIGLPSPFQFPATPLPQCSETSSLLRVFAGSNEIDESCGGDVEEEVLVELDVSPGTANGTKFSVLQKV